MLKIEKQQDAEGDLVEGMWLYSNERWREKQADHYHDRLIIVMDLIARHPEIWVECNKIREEYRRSTIKSHGVY